MARGYGWVGALVVALASGCNGGSGINVDVMTGVIGSLPSLPSPAGGQALRVGDPVTDPLATTLFGLQCHWDNESPGSCPAHVAADLSTKYSNDTLLGLIAHAEMRTNELFGSPGAATCQVGTSPMTRSVSRSSFVSHDAGGDGSRFVVDSLSRMGCTDVMVAGGPLTLAWSKPDGKMLESIVFEKGSMMGGDDQSSLVQTLVLLDAQGAPRALAANNVNITIKSSGSNAYRALLVVNFATRRFLVKNSGDFGNALVAAGQAGLTPDGLGAPGRYFVRTTFEPPDETPPAAGYCVDNTTRIVVESAACATEAGAWAVGDSAASYLELAAEDADVLAPWLAYFADGPTTSFLPASESPTLSDRIDLPDEIQ